MRFAFALLAFLLASPAYSEGTALYPLKRFGGYQVQISTLDESKSWVSVQILDRNGNAFQPGNVPLRAEYAARNVPFTSLPLEARGMDMVGYVPVPEGQSYTLKLQLKSGQTTFNPRFFINRSANVAQ